MFRPYILAEVPWKFVRETAYRVAVLPWGATEAHNLHLPYGTDIIQCDYIAAEAARVAWEAGAQVVVLPTVPFGVNTGQLDIRLDINMNPSTQMAVLRDVVDALSRQGIPNLVVMNGHGGNDFKQMLRELQVLFPEVFLCTLNWYQVGDLHAFFDEPGDHAGEMETSNMMHIVPDLVLPLEEAGDGFARPFALRALRERWVWAQREWSQVTDDTGVGDPSRSTPEKGRRYLEMITNQIGEFLTDLAATSRDGLYVRA
jgi:creatinine amidohydrolase